MEWECEGQVEESLEAVSMGRDKFNLWLDGDEEVRAPREGGGGPRVGVGWGGDEKAWAGGERPGSRASRASLRGEPAAAAHPPPPFPHVPPPQSALSFLFPFRDKALHGPAEGLPDWDGPGGGVGERVCLARGWYSAEGGGAGRGGEGRMARDSGRGGGPPRAPPGGCGTREDMWDAGGAGRGEGRRVDDWGWDGAGRRLTEDARAHGMTRARNVCVPDAPSRARVCQ